MVILVQLAERQIVALEVKGSIPLDHPIFYLQSLGCRQVVRHWILIPTLRRFESYHPSHKRNFRKGILNIVLGCRQAVRHKILILACVGSNPATPAKQKFTISLIFYKLSLLFIYFIYLKLIF